MGLIILYFLGALSLSFLCSVLEAVLLSTPMSFISMKENQGNKTASLMKQYKNNVDRPVGAILSLNTIAHTIGSAGVGAESMKLFGEEYFRHSHSVDSGTFRNHPENYRSFILALSCHDIYQDHPCAHHYQLSFGTAFGTYH